MALYGALASTGQVLRVLPTWGYGPLAMVPEGNICRAGLSGPSSGSRGRPSIGSSMIREVCSMQAIVY